MGALRDYKTSLVYLVIGQVGWFACVLSAARGISPVGIAVVLIAAAWHFAHARRPLEELKLVAVVTLIGAMWDSVMVLTGLLYYPTEGPTLHHAPYWIVALWLLFAIQLNVAYGWMKQRLLLAALLGAVAGPLSFRAGAALHAVRLERGEWTLCALAIGWALMLPLVSVLARRWDGMRVSSYAAP